MPDFPRPEPLLGVAHPHEVNRFSPPLRRRNNDMRLSRDYHFSLRSAAGARHLRQTHRFRDQTGELLSTRRRRSNLPFWVEMCYACLPAFPKWKEEKVRN